MPSKEVFIPRKNKERKGVNVSTIMGNKETKGEVGIEIEVEGYKLPIFDAVPSPWKYVEDHSLRPPKSSNKYGHGMTGEYVLKSPIAFDKVTHALNILWGVFDKSKTKMVDSNRTSVHVHLNCQQFFLNRLAAFCALYFIVEVPITEWCGDHRVGNLFCLRAVDAEAIPDYIKEFIQADGHSPIQEFLHYSALNANALKKYGSLELRTLQGCNDPTIILDWVEILERLYNLSDDYTDPRDICSSLSSVGPLEFFNAILGPKANLIRDGIDMTDAQLSDAVYQGVRIAQDICYCRDWDLYKPMKIKTDPFGRSSSKVAKKLINSPPIQPGSEGANAPPGFYSGEFLYGAPTLNVTDVYSPEQEFEMQSDYDDD